MISQAVSEYASSSSPSITTFRETLKQSTYLLALVIGEMEFTETSIEYDGSAQRSGATPLGSKNEGGMRWLEQQRLALSASSPLAFLSQKWIWLPFPILLLALWKIGGSSHTVKLHCSWTHTIKPIGSAESCCCCRTRVGTPVFGNLVTMDWWNDLWLNEGFATYTEYQGTNEIDPNFEVWTQFLEEVTAPALALDGTRTATHKLHQDPSAVQSTGSIEELFDTIDYSKGGAVIRMVATTLDLIERDLWSRSIERYLRDHMYGNAKANDLWNAIALVSKDLAWPERLNSWSNQEGYPLITVDNPLALSQVRFFNNYVEDL